MICKPTNVYRPTMFEAECCHTQVENNDILLWPLSYVHVLAYCDTILKMHRMTWICRIGPAVHSWTISLLLYCLADWRNFTLPQIHGLFRINHRNKIHVPQLFTQKGLDFCTIYIPRVWVGDNWRSVFWHNTCCTHARNYHDNCAEERWTRVAYHGVLRDTRITPRKMVSGGMWGWGCSHRTSTPLTEGQFRSGWRGVGRFFFNRNFLCRLDKKECI